jgi:hypothetical protein
MAHCSQYSAISRDYIAYWSWELRYRTGYVGPLGDHSSGRRTEHFNAAFWDQCGDIMRILDLRVPMTPDWIGTAGAGFCKSGYHGQARALDITQVRYTDGTYIDTNYSWRGGTRDRRWYVGLAAQCRAFVGTVLTAWYNADHQNHIHIDNGSPFVPVQPGWRSDTVLIQAVCNTLVGETLTIDGAWGPRTETAYNRLRTLMGVCGNPKTNAGDASVFFSLIGETGLNGRYAGIYQGSC